MSADVATIVASVVGFLRDVWGALGPVAGIAIGYYVARRSARNDEQRKWMIEFRRIASRAEFESMRTVGIAAFAQDVAQRMGTPISDKLARKIARDHWEKVSVPLDADLRFYLEVVPGLDSKARGDALIQWIGSTTDDEKQTADDYRKQMVQLEQTLSSIIVAMDKRLGLATERARASADQKKNRREVAERLAREDVTRRS